MRISFSHQMRFTSDRLALEKTGDRIRINGDLFNFNGLNDGDRIRRENIPGEWFAGDVTKTDGEVHLTLILPHGMMPEPWQLFPDDIENVPDGVVDIPFDTWSETSETIVEGGKNIVTTTHRWHQADQVATLFVPDPPMKPEQEETDHVDA